MVNLNYNPFYRSLNTIVNINNKDLLELYSYEFVVDSSLYNNIRVKFNFVSSEKSTMHNNTIILSNNQIYRDYNIKVDIEFIYTKQDDKIFCKLLSNKKCKISHLELFENVFDCFEHNVNDLIPPLFFPRRQSWGFRKDLNWGKLKESSWEFNYRINHIR